MRLFILFLTFFSLSTFADPCPDGFDYKQIKSSAVSESYCVGAVSGYVSGGKNATNRIFTTAEAIMSNQIGKTSQDYKIVFQPSSGHKKYINDCRSKQNQGYLLVNYNGRPRCYNTTTKEMPDPHGYLTGKVTEREFSIESGEGDSRLDAIVNGDASEHTPTPTATTPQQPQPSNKTQCDNETCIRTLVLNAAQSGETSNNTHDCGNNSDCHSRVKLALRVGGRSPYKATNAIMKCGQYSGDDCYLKEALNSCSGDESCQQGILSAGPSGDLNSQVNDIQGAAQIQPAKTDEDLREYTHSCENKRQEAHTCCNDVLSCVTGEPELMGKIFSTVTQVMQMTSMSGAVSMSKHCSQIEDMANIGSVASLASSGVCSDTRKTCENSCLESSKELEDLKMKYSSSNCSSNDFNGLALKLNKDFRENCSKVSAYERAYNNIQDDIRSCQSYEQAQNTHISNSLAQVIQSKLAKRCKEAVQEQATGLPMDDTPFNGDCTNPINSTNPLCLFCRDPLNRNSQRCASLILPNNNTAGGSNSGRGRRVSSDTSDGALGNDFGDGGDDDDLLNPDTQGFNATNAAGETSNPGVAGGGGGGGPQASGDATGGGLSPQNTGGGQGGGAGYKTDILRGARGGGGYTSNVAVSSGGGFRGYSSNGSKYNNGFDQNKRFSLKDYLPSKKVSDKRKLATLSKINNPEIGGAHVNIFQRVSHRYTAICRLRRLMDCK